VLSQAILFKQIDSRPGVAKHGFHTAIDLDSTVDPTEIPSDYHRHNVEVRVVCAFEKEPKGMAAKL
jgi:hypothetical protein